MSWLKNSVSVAIPLPGAPEGTRMGRQDPTWTLDKSPLPLTEVKPLAVGHWGTTPGQNFISVHLNGYNISNPTVLARIEPPEVDALLPGCGNDPRYVEGEDPAAPHQLMAAVLEEAIEDILSVHSAARVDGCTRWPRWPVLVLRSPKEWTGPKTVDGLPVEGTFRSHQVPLLVEDAHPEHGERLEQWLRTYRPEELFDECAKLKIRALPWRQDTSSLDYLLASHLWRQDHNGFPDQDPCFVDHVDHVDHVVNKKADIFRIHLSPDTNSLLTVADHCLRSRHYIAVLVAGERDMPQWFSMADVDLPCCCDPPTLEVLAAVSIVGEHVKELKVRVVNVVDLLKLQSANEHPPGLSDPDYDTLFSKNKRIVLAFHEYPSLIHRLIHRRSNRNTYVRGYSQVGTITTAVDMPVRNRLDRFHLVQHLIDRLPQLGAPAEYLKQAMTHKLSEHNLYINQHSQDLPEICNWAWNSEVVGHG